MSVDYPSRRNVPISILVAFMQDRMYSKRCVCSPEVVCRKPFVGECWARGSLRYICDPMQLIPNALAAGFAPACEEKRPNDDTGVTNVNMDGRVAQWRTKADDICRRNSAAGSGRLTAFQGLHLVLSELH